MGTPTPKGAGVEAVLPRMARVSQEWPWVSREWPWMPKSSHGCPGGVELVLGLHQECPGVVKLVMELHHVSQGGKQGEFRDGGGSMWASFWQHRGAAKNSSKDECASVHLLMGTCVVR